MDVASDNFSSAKADRAYLEREKIMESGIYFHSKDCTFDLVHVTKSHRDEILTRSVITRIPEDVAMEKPVEMYESALEQIKAFDERVSKKND